MTATSCRTPAPAPPTGVAKREVFSGQSVALGAQKEYGPFAVVAGSLFEATMTGTGDPDLYVRFGAKPTTASYNCRPYTSGNAETCTFNAPTAGTYYINVRAYAAYSGVSLKGTISP